MPTSGGDAPVEGPEDSRPRTLARPILLAFLFTFMAARVLVFPIVARRSNIAVCNPARRQS